MFKKILQSLSRSQAAKQQPVSVPPPQPPPQAASPEPVARPVVQPVAKGAAAPVPVSKKAAKAVVTPAVSGPSAEELCEIKPGMTDEQVRTRLKLLYRRYNRSASSLDAGTRGEADTMLDAIVKVREARFGEI